METTLTQPALFPHPNPSPGGRGAFSSLLPSGEGLGMREQREAWCTCRNHPGLMNNPG